MFSAIFGFLYIKIARKHPWRYTYTEHKRCPEVTLSTESSLIIHTACYLDPKLSFGMNKPALPKVKPLSIFGDNLLPGPLSRHSIHDIPHNCLHSPKTVSQDYLGIFSFLRYASATSETNTYFHIHITK